MVLLASLLGWSGCQPPDDKAAREAAQLLRDIKEQDDKRTREAAQLLQEIKSAVSQTHRQGEAFLVMKSDQVIYLADIEVAGLNPDIVDKLKDLQQRHLKAVTTTLKSMETNNPALKQELKRIDDEIASTQSRTNGLAKAVRDELEAEFKTRGEELMAAGKRFKAQGEVLNPLLEEYRKIAGPYEKELKKLQAEELELEKKIDEHESYIFDQINDHIVKNKLKVPTIASSDGLFRTTSGSPHMREDRPDQTRFLVRKEPYPNLRGYYSWTHLQNIPAQLEDTVMSIHIKTAYAHDFGMGQQFLRLMGKIGEKRSELKAAVVPFWNRNRDKLPALRPERRKKPDSEIEHLQIAFVDLGEDVKDTAHAVKELNARLGPDRIDSAVEKELTKRRRMIDQKMKELQKKREKELQEVGRKEISEVRSKAGAMALLLLADAVITTGRTGSKGDFSMPADVEYVYASKSRENGEEIRWLIRVDKASPAIRLSNSNAVIMQKADALPGQWLLDHPL